MKKSLMFLLTTVALQAATLVPGHIACVKESWLRDTLRFGQQQDIGSLKTYLKMERCYVMKSPVPVKIITEKPDVVEFFLRGKQLWVVREGVR